MPRRTIDTPSLHGSWSPEQPATAAARAALALDALAARSDATEALIRAKDVTGRD